jgi:hypothetical protein
MITGLNASPNLTEEDREVLDENIMMNHVHSILEQEEGTLKWRMVCFLN